MDFYAAEEANLISAHGMGIRVKERNLPVWML